MQGDYRIEENNFKLEEIIDHKTKEDSRYSRSKKNLLSNNTCHCHACLRHKRLYL